MDSKKSRKPAKSKPKPFTLTYRHSVNQLKKIADKYGDKPPYWID